MDGTEVPLEPKKTGYAAGAVMAKHCQRGIEFMKYKLTMEFETEIPYKEWDVSSETNSASNATLAVALIHALGIQAKETLIDNIILQKVD